MRRGLLIAVAGIGVAVGLVGTGLAQSSPGATPRSNGTFRISLWGPSLTSVDPAFALLDAKPTILDTTCARLMAYPDKPAPAGFRLVPEVAVGFPRASRDLKTWTFTIREGFRFSNGAPVRADAFARAIHRTLAPGVNSQFVKYTRDIVGAADVLAGTRTTASGVVVDGNRLVVRFTRPVPDFPAQTTMVAFCAVPPRLPSDPEGVRAFPAAGPYYVAEFRPGERAVLERNRYYGGTRPHYVDRFVIDLTPGSREAALDQVDRGEADWTTGLPPPVMLDPARALVARYGVNRARFFVKRGLIFRHYALNNAGPLFKDNPRLRRAVNFAIDRAAQLQSLGGPLATTLSDQYLPGLLPAYRNERIYPLNGPDLERAKALARGATRTGEAVLYTRDNPPALALAQLVKRDLAAIGLEVEVRAFAPAALLQRLSAPGERWDLGFYFTGADYIDPYAFLNTQFDGRFSGTSNVSRFDSAEFNKGLRRAARLEGAARELEYGRLDVALARDAAPVIGVGFQTVMTLVSNRVGCVLHNPEFNLTTVCLKR